MLIFLKEIDFESLLKAIPIPTETGTPSFAHSPK